MPKALIFLLDIINVTFKRTFNTFLQVCEIENGIIVSMTWKTVLKIEIGNRKPFCEVTMGANKIHWGKK